MGKLHVGMFGTYPHYRNFKHLIDIPAAVALAWVQRIAPDARLGRNLTAKEITLDNLEEEWLNKGYIIIGAEHDQWVALYSADDTFSIQYKKIEPADFEDE